MLCPPGKPIRVLFACFSANELCCASVCRFMESELDLNDIIQEMHVIATMPDLYHLLVELNAVQSLLGLLGHDNTDILLCSASRGRAALLSPLLPFHKWLLVILFPSTPPSFVSFCSPGTLFSQVDFSGVFQCS